MSEFVFGRSRIKKNYPNIKKNISDNLENLEGKTLKEKLLAEYDYLQYLKTEDKYIKDITKELERKSTEIVTVVNILNKKKDEIISKELKDKPKELTSEYNKLKQKYDNYLKEKLSFVYNTYPEIYEMFNNGLPRDTLEDVLNTVSDMESGKISKKQAIDKGVKFMTSKYNLPPNMFDQNTLDQLAK